MALIQHQLGNVWSIIFKPLMYWVSTRVSPEKPRELIKGESPILVYVLPKRSRLDRYILHRMCKKFRLPVPEFHLDLKKPRSATVLYLNDSGMFRVGGTGRSDTYLQRLVQLQKEHLDRRIQLVPVSPFWGKNPGRSEESFFKLIFHDDEHAGWLQRSLIVLVQGRNHVLNFSAPFYLDEIEKRDVSSEVVARKIRRLLKVHFRRQRNTVLGKKLYNREEVISSVANGRMVREQIEAELKQKSGKTSARSLEVKARNYVRELSADQGYSMVRFFELVLGRLWNKLFDGVEIRNLDNVRSLAEKDYEIVYVPTHRSHLDYLLTSYTIYQSGMPSPHIAAGINLNFFPMGWFLRRAGAFFIRRSFRGNRLYTAVVNEYVHYLLTKGYPMTFFPEGGRSRTGKLLPLKTGMLAMVVHSFLRNSNRPLALVPTYLGYDKVMEVRSYMSELSGSRKKKESFLSLLKARKLLQLYYGKAYVSYGEPIILGEYLNEQGPDWLEVQGQTVKPQWMPSLVQKLGSQLSVGMNQTAIVTPLSLISLGLLSSWQKALPKESLFSFIETVRSLYKKVPYSREVSLPQMSAEEMLENSAKLEMHTEFSHGGGSVVHLNEEQSVLISYYRNSIIHLFALPSLVARFFRHQERVTLAEITSGCLEVYPFLKEEFYLPWAEGELAPLVENYVEGMVAVGLLVKDGEFLARSPKDLDQIENLNLLGNSLGLTFERYTITAALLARHSEQGYVDADAFEMQCQKMAQRLAILNGVNNPEFVERGFVEKHVALLKRRGLLIPEEGGRLQIDPKVSNLAKYSTKLLSYDARESIDRIFAGK